jgi:predicted phosphodiesterase
MIFQIISDIHLEFNNKFKVRNLYNKFTETMTEPREINLIIAGDLGWPTEKSYKNFLDETTKYYDNIFLIAGNHEFYCCKKNNLLINDVTQLIQSIVNDINLANSSISEQRGHIQYLNNKMILHNNVYIIGSTLWTHVDNSYKKYSVYMNDYEFIKNFNVDDSNALHTESVNFLKNSLEFVKSQTIQTDTTVQTDTPTKCIVITHHMPSFELIDRKYKDMKETNVFFASNLDEIISYPVSYWIYGHTHTQSIKHINGVKLICNPKGYPSERSGYDNKCIIEL